ncbi:hypothetical protein H2509_15280 [Stappia sp. F7233]|uniref:Lipocalin-like domain-containing protein n=1 Tax=Stappia albiluteola TaxID=2758565 RepID=A0A839AFR4_9HYPH|nr:hypothetical protein [Stappia albiluteola]MBA5778491.1 hypothetical protein [Stappia albiluteola]
MQDKIRPFLGTWLLDLDDSEFDQSALPRSGSCRIEEEFGLVNIRMSLVESGGDELNVVLSGIPDGPETPMRESGLIDSMVLYFEGSRTLTSQARRNGVPLMTARRTLSDDGHALEIEQTVEVPGQGLVSNTAIYRRAQ